LTLTGNVTYDATNNPGGSTLSGKLGLGAVDRTFNIGNSSSATAGSDLTLSAVLSGSGGLVKTGAGTLELTANNTGYTGVSTVNAGVLKTSADNNLGTAPGAPLATSITLGGGTLDAAASFTLNSNRGVTLTNATNSAITAESAQTLTY